MLWVTYNKGRRGGQVLLEGGAQMFLFISTPGKRVVWLLEHLWAMDIFLCNTLRNRD